MFAAMLFTGSKTIAYLTIPVLTVFKNTTNLLIAWGDWYFFGQYISLGVIGSFALMVVGSVLSGLTDMQYNATGYLWMAANVLSQVGQSFNTIVTRLTDHLSSLSHPSHRPATCFT